MAHDEIFSSVEFENMIRNEWKLCVLPKRDTQIPAAISYIAGNQYFTHENPVFILTILTTVVSHDDKSLTQMLWFFEEILNQSVLSPAISVRVGLVAISVHISFHAVASAISRR